MKEANHRKIPMTWFHLHEMSSQVISCLGLTNIEAQGDGI